MNLPRSWGRIGNVWDVHVPRKPFVPVIPPILDFGFPDETRYGFKDPDYHARQKAVAAPANGAAQQPVQKQESAQSVCRYDCDPLTTNPKCPQKEGA